MTLQYSGEEQIPTSRAAVWAFIIDPEKVGHSLPDVLDVTVQDPTHCQATVKVGVGPVRGKFRVKIELIPEPSGSRIDMKINLGGFGSAVDLTAGADLIEAGEQATILKWSGQAVARGPIAAVGGRVLDAQAQKLIAQAFAGIRQQLTTA